MRDKSNKRPSMPSAATLAGWVLASMDSLWESFNQCAGEAERNPDGVQWMKWELLAATLQLLDRITFSTVGALRRTAVMNEAIRETLVELDPDEFDGFTDFYNVRQIGYGKLSRSAVNDGPQDSDLFLEMGRRVAAGCTDQDQDQQGVLVSIALMDVHIAMLNQLTAHLIATAPEKI